MVRTRQPHIYLHLTVFNVFARFVLGILIVLFFQCMIGLLNSVNRRRQAVKWGLVSYTVVMFVVATVLTGMGLNLGSLSFIDNREFPGVEGVVAPGPLGYQVLINSTALRIVPSFMFLLNYWLADGLLVSSLLILHPLAWVSNPLPALSLLRTLRRKPLGHRLPRPHVPRLLGCVPEFSVAGGDTLG